eukprot:SAG31_NODE_7875_length_1576_cov_1.593771_1_plen_334_part_00
MLLGEWLAQGSPAPAPVPLPKAARCGLVAENQVLTLGCAGGKTIDKVLFASFGTPILADAEQSCAAGFKEGICSTTGKIGSSARSRPVVERLCLNKTSCAVPADRATFDDQEGPPHDPCGHVVKALAAEIHCSGDPPGALCKGACYDYPPPPPPGPDPESAARTYPQISGGAQQYENHILRTGNHRPLTTLFCWHGFQYVRVHSTGSTGFKGGIDDIVGMEIHTNMTQTGHLTFGGEGEPAAEHAAAVLGGIQQMTLQSQRTNVAAYMPTDCPTREKHGWMGVSVILAQDLCVCVVFVVRDTNELIICRTPWTLRSKRYTISRSAQCITRSCS